MHGVGEAAYALRLLEQLGAEYAEAYLENSFSKSFALEHGKLSASDYIEGNGIRIRFVKGKRLYTFSTNRIDKGTIQKQISRFRQFRGFDTEFCPARVEHADYSVKEKESVKSADMLRDLQKIDRELSRIKYLKFRNIYGGLGRTHTYYINSDGAEISCCMPSVSAFYIFTVGNGTETRQSVIQKGNVAGYECFDAGKVADELEAGIKNVYEVMEKGVTLSDSEMKRIKNVVISPEISGIAVHESVGHPNEADRVYGREAAQAGVSYMTKKNLGLEIGSREVTVVDDPTIRGVNGFFLYDDEGVRTRPKTLIEKGRQKELLMNRAYASILGTKSNGSARSDSYSNEPLIRMSNTYLKPAKADFDELLSEAKNGVYLKRFDGTEWNIDDTRSFSRYKGNEAYMIKNGSVEKPVKNYMLETFTLDFWHAVKLVGNDFELYTGSCGKGEPMQGVPVTMGGASALLSFR